MELSFLKPKKRAPVTNRNNEDKDLRPGASAATSTENQLPVETDQDSDFDGLTLEQYATKRGCSTSNVWLKLRRGELVGRTEGGQLFIYESTENLRPIGGFKPQPHRTAPTEAPIRQAAVREPELPTIPEIHLKSETETTIAGLPPLPNSLATIPQTGAVTVIGDQPYSQEIALLIDHLSLAKEENREILKLTQESLEKVTKLADSIVEAKEAMIEVRDTQIEGLNDKIDNQDKVINKLKQDKEDTDMLMLSLSKD